MLLNKKIGNIDVYEKTVIQLLSAAIILIPYLLLTENIGDVQFGVTNIVMLLFIGIVHTGIAYILYFGSMDGVKAQTIAAFGYIDPVTALILSSIVLQESMKMWGMIGAVLIIGGAMLGETKFS